MSFAVLALIQFAIIAYAVVCGVFLAFSDFIMRSLGKASDNGGVEAMQNINREVFRWVFMGLFLGLAPVSLILGGYGFFVLSGTTGYLIGSAGLAYLIGCFGVTIIFNVPMNETLGVMTSDQPGTSEYWTQIYLPNWTYWNTVRTIACALASILLLFALTSPLPHLAERTATTQPTKPVVAA